MVFGAAVRPGGRASPALARRIDLAADLARRHPQASLFLSGAIGRHPPSEASVMAALLDGRVDRSRLILDDDSRDTLQSVRAAVDYARGHGVVRCIACTDRYHQPRARMLFRLFGMRSAGARPSVQWQRTAVRRRWYMRLREAAALPYDLIAGLDAVRRARRRRR